MMENIKNEKHIGSIAELKKEILDYLCRTPEIDIAMNRILAITGNYFKVDRAYIFENTEDDLYCINSYEWCNEGIEPEKEHLQHLSYERDLGGTWTDNFDENGIFFCPTIDALPKAQQEVLRPQHITSMLQSSVVVRGKFKGYIGFDNCSKQNKGGETDPDAVDTLIYISHLLTLYLLDWRERTNQLQRQERNLHSQLKQSEEALESANKATQAKSDFLSRMSHEIRTPMNGIIGMTKLAEDVATDPKVLEYLHEIDESSQYMLGLLNDVLDMSRIESGSFELHREWTSATMALWPCIMMMEPVMQTKGIRFIHPDTGRVSRVEFLVDPLRMKQVVMNLLNNACKFTPENGTVTLDIKNLTCKDGIAMDCLTISDTGCGMSREFLENGIFKSFSQEQNIYSEQVRGTGLGLALVKEIVDKMDGSIEVESELGKGTTFRVRFQYQYRIQEETPVRKTQKEDIGILHGKRVLLVEDYALNRKIADALLKKQNILVEQAENGKAALDMFCSAAPFWFDAILMDVRMPKMDGHEATKAIRALDRADARSVPIIAMTANAFAEDIEQSKAAGMNAHLAKPVDPELLYQTLAELIRNITDK